MHKKYEVLQVGAKECGSACLLSVIKYYGGSVPINRLLELTNTTKEGTNFYNLKEAALEIGLSAKAYKTDDILNLMMIDKPFLSQVNIENYLHFIVVYKINNSKLTIMDPARGIKVITLSEFENIWTGNIMILEPYRSLPNIRDTSYIKDTLVNLLLNNKLLIINLLGLTILIMIFTFLYSYHFKIIVDNILSINKPNLLAITIIFLVISLIKYLTTYLRNNLLLYLNQKIDLSLITSTINKILLLPLSYYKQKTTGDTIARINDLMYLKNTISKIITNILLNTLLSFIALIVLFTINNNMTLLLLIIALFYFLIFLIFKPFIKKRTILNQEKSAKLSSLFVDTISSYETIKGLNLENYFKNRITSNYLDLTNNNLTLSKYLNLSEFLKNIVESVIIIIVIYLGITNIMDKSMTLGALITYNTIIIYFISPIREFFNYYQELVFFKNSIKRINSLISYDTELLTEPIKLNMKGGIYIKNLTFNYNNHNLILKNFNLEIHPHNKVLILGSTGSGKTTFLKILYKYYEIPRDKVFISGYDINDFNLSDIRKNIAFITRHEYLYSDTIRNNIILNRKVTEEEFLHICKLTTISDIVKNKTLAYDFCLEENGTNISSGERARIILARALLKDSQIILIDEGFNELDINTERTILKNIFNAYPEKVFLIISHRKDNMDLYNQVIKIEKGHLVEGLNKYV